MIDSNAVLSKLAKNYFLIFVLKQYTNINYSNICFAPYIHKRANHYKCLLLIIMLQRIEWTVNTFSHFYLDMKQDIMIKLLHIFELCLQVASAGIALWVIAFYIACLQLNLEVPQFCRIVTQIWRISKQAFLDCSEGKSLSAVITTGLLLKHSLIQLDLNFLFNKSKWRCVTPVYCAVDSVQQPMSKQEADSHSNAAFFHNQILVFHNQ